jgi:hypothetical protein
MATSLLPLTLDCDLNVTSVLKSQPENKKLEGSNPLFWLWATHIMWTPLLFFMATFLLSLTLTCDLNRNWVLIQTSIIGSLMVELVLYSTRYQNKMTCPSFAWQHSYCLWPWTVTWMWLVLYLSQPGRVPSPYSDYDKLWSSFLLSLTCDLNMTLIPSAVQKIRNGRVLILTMIIRAHTGTISTNTRCVDYFFAWQHHPYYPWLWTMT